MTRLTERALPSFVSQPFIRFGDHLAECFRPELSPNYDLVSMANDKYPLQNVLLQSQLELCCTVEPPF